MINTEREGVSAVQSIVYRELKWVFREQTVDDFGIDAEIEVANQRYPTGKMIAVQIKSGSSYFISTTEEGVIYRFDEKHKNYWLKHTLPVIILLYHPVSLECIWEVIANYTIKQVSDKGYKIVIPKENQFGVSTKTKLLILAYSSKIKDLAEDIDDLNVNREAVFAMLDDKQKKMFLEARIIIDKKNASSDREPFEYNREELSDFVGIVRRWDIKDDIFESEQFKKSVCHIEEFICGTRINTLIILGEAGIGKTTLVRTVMKTKILDDVLYIHSPRCCKDISDRLQMEYNFNNNSSKVVIIDGWDALVPKETIKVWYKLMDLQKYNKDIKLIITSRHMENCVWENADIIRMYPLSQMEALVFLKNMIGDSFVINESVTRLANTFNTPLMLKTLVKATNQLGIPLEKATRDNLLFSFISQYSEEENYTLESIASKMMRENKIIIAISDERYLKYLSTYKELYIEKEQVTFSHRVFYEIFAAKYIFRHVFKDEKESQEFCVAVWDIFANNICSLDILSFLKYLIKHDINDDFVKQLNDNFNYMLEKGMLLGSTTDSKSFKAISNVFYMVWHIVSFANRIHHGVFKPEISKNGEINLSCLINVFNKIYFSETYLDFSHTDLSYKKLWRCNLTNMNFKNSRLIHTNFLGSCLDGSNFQQADLSYSNLVTTDLRHVNLKDAILTGANVGNCMISENSLKYFSPYKDTLRHVEKLIVFMDDGTIKYYFDML